MSDVRLGEHCFITKLAGFEYTKHFDYEVSGDIIALRSLNIKNGRLDLTSVHTMPKSVSDALPRSKLKTGDIVLGYVGSRLGNLAMVEVDDKFHLAPNVAMIRPAENVEPRYLLQFMLGPLYQSRLWALAGSTGQPALSMANVRKSKVWLPPLPEQRKIADILSTWDAAIEKTEALLATARTQKRALMQQLLTGKRRFPEFEGEPWKEVRLGDMGTTVSGGTPDSTIPAYWDGDIDWATPTDITKLTSRFIRGTARRITPEGLKKSSAKLVGKGALLICTRATIGDLAITTGPICTNQGFKNLVLSNDHDPDFVFYLLQFFKNELIRYACGSTFLELSKKDFDKRSFKVPAFDEQKRIAAVLNDAEDQIAEHAQSITKLRTEKKALMQQLLTGKRRVTVEDHYGI